MLYRNRDVWETKWCQQLCGSLTWHIFNKAPPTKVYAHFLPVRRDLMTHRPQITRLDLGCGTGTWILEAAKEWKVCGLRVRSLSAC